MSAFKISVILTIAWACVWIVERVIGSKKNKPIFTFVYAMIFASLVVMGFIAFLVIAL